MVKPLDRRLRALERRCAPASCWPIAWPSIEAAAAAGIDGGILIVGPIMSPEEWTQAAVERQRRLAAGD